MIVAVGCQGCSAHWSRPSRRSRRPLMPAVPTRFPLRDRCPGRSTVVLTGSVDGPAWLGHLRAVFDAPCRCQRYKVLDQHAAQPVSGRQDHADAGVVVKEDLAIPAARTDCSATVVADSDDMGEVASSLCSCGAQGDELCRAARKAASRSGSTRLATTFPSGLWMVAVSTGSTGPRRTLV